MATYDTATNILNQAAQELGLASAAVADPYSSTDPIWVQLRALLNSAGRELARAHDWQQLRAEHTFTTSTATTYALPTGWRKMVSETAWDRTADQPLTGPVTPQRWANLRASGTSATVSPIFRVRANLLELLTAPTAGSTWAYEYQTEYWVGSSSPTASAATAASDSLWFDPLLLNAALKLRYLEAKGFDSTTALAAYQRAFDAATSDSEPAPTLSLTGGGGFHLLDESNIPETGYGS